MLQSELNTVWAQVLLYYVNQMIPGRRYEMWATNLGLWDYDEEGNLEINVWFPTDIIQPTIETLLSYNLADVNSFWQYQYNLPNTINNSQPFVRVSAAELALIPAALNIEGNVVFNTDVKRLQFWSGIEWTVL